MSVDFSFPTFHTGVENQQAMGKTLQQDPLQGVMVLQGLSSTSKAVGDSEGEATSAPFNRFLFL